MEIIEHPPIFRLPGIPDHITYTWIAMLVLVVVSIAVGHWSLVAALLIWWLLSRTFKIVPHLRRRPADLLLVPLFIGVTYYMSLIKTYALCTLTQHKWLTRAVAVVNGKVERVSETAQ